MPEFYKNKKDASMNIADEIQRLHELKQSGVITEAEFNQAKTKLLDEFNQSSSAQSDSSSGMGSSMFGSSKSNSQSNSVFSSQFSDFNSSSTSRSFRRSKTDRMLGGVCGGLAKISDVESWVWRVLFVIMTVFFGISILAYLLVWIFAPEEM
jgi:phage shock protein PspC (stress-responsive transcriptional regulator)